MAPAHDRRGHHKKAEKTLQATYPAEATAQDGILVRKAQNRPAQVRLQNRAGGVHETVVINQDWIATNLEHMFHPKNRDSF